MSTTDSIARLTFDEVRIEHLGLFKFKNGIFGVPRPEIHVCQAH